MNAFLKTTCQRRSGFSPVFSVIEHVRAALACARAPGLVALLCAIGIAGGLNSGVQAQDNDAPEALDMTVEELEAYIESQKAALEQVRTNRDITADKARKVQEALADEESRREEALVELEQLCQQQEALEPGSLEMCMASIEEP